MEVARWWLPAEPIPQQRYLGTMNEPNFLWLGMVLFLYSRLLFRWGRTATLFWSTVPEIFRLRAQVL